MSRLGDVGNAGPGPNLTHVESTLSTTQLEHAIIDPRGAMPSFSRLPAAKFKAVAVALMFLRRILLCRPREATTGVEPV
jgi:hypothetical protein